jgi:cytochrome c peroxidase
LELQAHDPVTNPIEMRNTWPTVVARLQSMPEYPPLFQAAFGSPGIDSVRVTKAIAQFERTLVSFNSRYDRFHFLGDSSALSPAEMRGRDIFMRDGHCVDCHSEVLLSDGAMRNNGLDVVSADPGLGAVTGQPSHFGRFKVTTLRNIAVTGPYMHDSRFQTLEEVVDFYALNVHTNAQNLDAHMAPWVDGTIDLDAQERADLVAFLHALTDSTFLTNPAFSAP